MFTATAFFSLIVAFVAAVVCFFVPRWGKPYALLIVLAATSGWLGAMVVSDISRDPVSELTVAFLIMSFLGALVLPLLVQRDLSGRK